jgi:hypothetical protein
LAFFAFAELSVIALPIGLVIELIIAWERHVPKIWVAAAGGGGGLAGVFLGAFVDWLIWPSIPFVLAGPILGAVSIGLAAAWMFSKNAKKGK